MANVGYATLQVVPSLKGFSSKLRLGMGGALTSEGKRAGEETGRSFASSFAKVAAGAAVAAGAIRLGKGFVDAAIESQKVGRQTEAVLKSMGNQAGLTADDIGKLATQQSLLSGVDDEVIQSAQNVLLTFGKVRNEVGKGNDIFNRGSQAALDMSVALKQDLQGATIQIGKALNDPIKGITALSRAGVSFTEQQKNQIKTLTKSGKTLEAQKLILKELENQFGGSAKAQATAGARLKVALGNIQEQIGKYLLPVVEKLADFLARNLPVAMQKAGAVLGPIFRTIGGGAKQLFAILFKRDFVGGGPFAEDSPFIGKVFQVRDAIVGFVKGSLKDLSDWWDRNGPTVAGAAAALAAVFTDKILPALRDVAVFIATDVIPALASIATWIVDNKPALIGLGVFVGTILVGQLAAWTVATWAQVSALFAQAVATLAAYWPLLLIAAGLALVTAAVIYAYTEWGWFRTAVDVAATAVGALNDVLSTMFDWLNKISEAAEAAGKALDKIPGMPDLSGPLGFVGDAVEQGILGPVLGPVKQVKDLLGFDKGGVVPGPLGKATLALVHGGEEVIPWHNPSAMSSRLMTPMAGGAGDGVAVAVSLGIDPAGAENAFMSWFLKAIRVRPAARKGLAT